MDYSVIEQYVIALAPMVTAIFSMIATVIVSIKKVKALSKSTTAQIEAKASEMVKISGDSNEAIRQLTEKVRMLIEDNTKLRADYEKLIDATNAKAEAINNVKKRK